MVFLKDFMFFPVHFVLWLVDWTSITCWQTNIEKIMYSDHRDNAPTVVREIFQVWLFVEWKHCKFLERSATVSFARSML